MKDFLTGFVAGEGCFTISGRTPAFEVELREEDARVLDNLRGEIGLGTIRKRNRGPYVRYQVRGIRQCWAVAQYFYDCDWHGAQKGDAFKRWVRALNYMRKGLHHSEPHKFWVLKTSINKR